MCYFLWSISLELCRWKFLSLASPLLLNISWQIWEKERPSMAVFLTCTNGSTFAYDLSYKWYIFHSLQQFSNPQKLDYKVLAFQRVRIYAWLQKILQLKVYNTGTIYSLEGKTFARQRTDTNLLPLRIRLWNKPDLLDANGRNLNFKSSVTLTWEV